MHADITERQQALINLEARENELTEHIQRFKDSVDGVPFGLSMYDADQRLIICNKPYVSIYDLSGINPGLARRTIRSWIASMETAHLPICRGRRAKRSGAARFRRLRQAECYPSTMDARF